MSLFFGSARSLPESTELLKLHETRRQSGDTSDPEATSVRILDGPPVDHPLEGGDRSFKYSRGDSHAAVQGSPFEETTDDELKGFCGKVLNLTLKGSVVIVLWD